MKCRWVFLNSIDFNILFVILRSPVFYAHKFHLIFRFMVEQNTIARKRIIF